MKPIIEVRNVWKSYKIGGKKENYLSLRDSLMGVGKSLLGQKKETFWALQDVSFDVMPGECIGIIGRNGAGKSTLLKILSQITPPTKGHIKMRGRVASLLEVGTGFHPELTGRENIYLNGSILGMRRTEINQVFDEIIDFSGVEKFLDTPLKHYSSGMRLRLAFAVAAHLNPEILLIDEVLAVGDAEFQKKCLGKMDEVSKSGRTVVFVSHDMGAVERLCKEGVLLSNGKISIKSIIQNTIFEYSRNIENIKAKTIVSNKGISLEEIIFLTPLESGQDLKFNIVLNNKNIKEEVFIDIAIIDELGRFSLHLRSPYTKKSGFIISNKDKVVFHFHIKSPNLIASTYTFTIYVYTKSNEELLWVENYHNFKITSDSNYIGLKSTTIPLFNISLDS